MNPSILESSFQGSADEAKSFKLLLKVVPVAGEATYAEDASAKVSSPIDAEVLAEEELAKEKRANEVEEEEGGPWVRLGPWAAGAAAQGASTIERQRPAMGPGVQGDGC